MLSDMPRHCEQREAIQEPYYYGVFLDYCFVASARYRCSAPQRFYVDGF